MDGPTFITRRLPMHREKQRLERHIARPGDHVLRLVVGKSQNAALHCLACHQIDEYP